MSAVEDILFECCLVVSCIIAGRPSGQISRCGISLAKMLERFQQTIVYKLLSGADIPVEWYRQIYRSAIFLVRSIYLALDGIIGDICVATSYRHLCLIAVITAIHVDDLLNDFEITAIDGADTILLTTPRDRRGVIAIRSKSHGDVIALGRIDIEIAVT